MGIMTDVGVLEGGKITAAARQSFIDDVNSLLLNGHDGSFFPTPDTLFFEGGPFLSTSFNVQPIEKHQETFRWYLEVIFLKRRSILI